MDYSIIYRQCKNVTICIEMIVQLDESNLSAKAKLKQELADCLESIGAELKKEGTSCQ